MPVSSLEFLGKRRVSRRQRNRLYRSRHFRVRAGQFAHPIVVPCLDALEVATLIAGLLSAAALVGSLLFLARQTSHSVQQSLVANELAGARAMTQSFEIADRVIAHFVHYPELRVYFYEGMELPEDATTRGRVLALAELMADAVQSASWLFLGKDVESLRSVDPAFDVRANMDDWTDFILTMSPAVRSVVRAHPLQYPYVVRKLDTIEPATTG